MKHPPSTCTQVALSAHQAWFRLKLTPPCDLQAVCDFLGIAVEKRLMYNDVHGMFIRMEDGRELIKLNSGLTVTELRITWAHEICHAITTTGPVTLECRAGFDEEQLCNVFARHLLVPDDALRDECQRLGHPKTNRFGSLAEIFQVDKALMSERLKDLGLDRPQVSQEARRSALEAYKSTKKKP